MLLAPARPVLEGVEEMEAAVGQQTAACKGNDARINNECAAAIAVVSLAAALYRAA
jgi:hypothetical protein